MRKTLIAATLIAALLCPWSALASCGTASCPIDLNALNRPTAGRFTAEWSFEYIDQDRPRIGSRSARIGELASATHDEVRTINRNSSLLLRYAVSDRVHLSVTTPFISRTHNHLGSTHAHIVGGRRQTALHNSIPQRWDVNGVGDIMVQGRARVWGSNMDGLWVIAGAKLPTGADDVTNGQGKVAEIQLQPGTGSTDFIGGLAYETGFVRGGGGNATMIPLFVSATYRANGSGAQGFNAGDEWQVNAGTAWPLMTRVELLLQANARHRESDRFDETGVGGGGHTAGPDPFTGGSAIYVSPGVRVSVGERAAVYTVFQYPVMQDVNGIQLTSEQNFAAGVQWRF